MPEHDLRSTAYPKLEPEQIQVIARCPHTRRARYADGDKLFDVGDRDFTFFVVQSGATEIVDSSGDTSKTLVVHGPGEFTGDVAHLTGAASLVSAVAHGETSVYEIDRDGLRHILTERPQLGDLILQAFVAHRQLLSESGSFTGVRVIGSRYSKDTLRIRDFLATNRVPFTWLDVETDPQVGQLLARFGVATADAPIVSCGDRLLLRNPSDGELGTALGIRRPLTDSVYDLVVVGAGPAGLAAAVYGASEGLSTAVLERTAPGGQAGTSMRIENYLGFPTGIVGRDLADRAVLQADKFGAIIPLISAPVVRLRFDNGYPALELSDGQSIAPRVVLIERGPTIEGCRSRAARVSRVAASTTRRRSSKRGSAAARTSSWSAAATLPVRPRSSSPLTCARCSSWSAATACTTRCRATSLSGSSTQSTSRCSSTPASSACWATSATDVELRNVKKGEVRTVQTDALSSFIGAAPPTDWLPREVATDERGFIHTGPALEQEVHPDGDGEERRRPPLIETSHPRVLAAGDVRSGSIKRVASAVGEGMAVQMVHETLKRR